MFHCEVCELATHHKTSFLLSDNRSSPQFTLINTDVQGPHIPNISRSHWFMSFIDDYTVISWFYLFER